MDGSDSRLLPFLPYILQNLWNIGSDPDGFIRRTYKHTDTFKKLKVLDFGCGKGIVSVNIAQKLNYKCHGIDAIPNSRIMPGKKPGKNIMSTIFVNLKQ